MRPNKVVEAETRVVEVKQGRGGRDEVVEAKLDRGGRDKAVEPE